MFPTPCSTFFSPSPQLPSPEPLYRHNHNLGEFLSNMKSMSKCRFQATWSAGLGGNQPSVWAAVIGKIGLIFTHVEGGEDSVWKEC